MAIVRRFIKSDHINIISNITETDCIYRTAFHNGDKYIVLSTCGSEKRKIKGKCSQVIHLNRQTANKLIEILKDELGID